jgi:hypothetical protein
MKAGRKPIHAFNSLEIGQKALLRGSAKTYPHQFIYQYNKKKDRKLELIQENGKLFARRIK